jgi:purine nucleosidase
MAQGPRPTIIDTDPGQDDAVAMLMALASPELEVLGVTTVAGNVPQPLVTRNALQIVELAGQTVPVYRGADRPLLRDLYTAEYVHGPTGIDGCDLPEPVTAPASGHAVDFIVETCLGSADASITICPLGPLTNIAAAVTENRSIVPKIREIVLMGGAFSGGNTTPVAEFNIYVDPHAAQIVFDAGAPLTMMPLDVTHKALVTTDHLDRLRAAGTRTCDAAAGMLGFYSRFDMDRYGIAGGPLHDPCVIGYLLRPELFSGRAASVAVETESELTMGQTVGDFWAMTGRPTNAMVMLDIDADAFLDLVIQRLAGL